MLNLLPADSITAAMDGAATTTNPTAVVRYLKNGVHQSSLVNLNGTTSVTLMSGVTATAANPAAIIELVDISLCNVDTTAQTVTLTASLGGTSGSFAVLTMQPSDHQTVDENGKVTGVNSSGQALTQLSPTIGVTTLTGTADAIPPHTTATYFIKGTSAIDAATLAAPTATTDDGKVIVVTSSSAYAHTITATGLFQTGSTTVNVATFAAHAGASIGLMANQGKWNVLYTNAVTMS